MIKGGILFFGLLFPFYFLSQVGLENPVTSVASGFYGEEFTMEISHPDPEAIILYTIDGSSPLIENISGKEWEFKRVYPSNPGDAVGELLKDTVWTYQYNTPILIKDRSTEMDRYSNVATSVVQNMDYYNNYGFFVNKSYKSTVLRAVAYKNGEYSDVITRNYFIDEGGENHYSFPIVSLSVEPEDVFSFETGVMVPGKVFDDWRADNPNEALGIWVPGNFRVSGQLYERLINVSYFDEGEEQINQNAGLRLHGHGSRVYANKSLRLYARAEYGENKFRYKFFDDIEFDEFKRLILRNSGSDTEWSMFRDVFIQESSKKLNVIIQESQPTVVLINGEYFGIFNLRERIDRKFFKQKYGLEETEIDFIKRNEVKDGDSIAFYELLDFVNNSDLSNEETFHDVSEKVDLENFTDYNIAEVFMGNIDWPDNNNNKFRKRVPYDSTAPFGHDGRWRWHLVDFDFSLGKGGVLAPWAEGVNYNHLNRLTTVHNSDFDNYTILIRGLLENTAYKNKFINRFCDIMNSTYKPSVLTNRLSETADIYEPEMEEFTKRWNPLGYPGILSFPVNTKVNWQGFVTEMTDFIDERPNWIREHIKNRFTAGEVKEVIVDVSGIEEGNVNINTLFLDENTDGIESASAYPWTGKYFENVPITLCAIPKPGYEFSHWSGEVNDTIAEITIDLANDVYIKANFVPAEDLSVEVNSPRFDIKIYPNPFKDEINVLLADYEDVKYRLYSVKGTLLQEGPLTQPKIKLKGYKNGVFLLEIEKGNNIVRKKIIRK